MDFFEEFYKSLENYYEIKEYEEVLQYLITFS